MQPYYIIEKRDTEHIRFQHAEVAKSSQTIATGYDTYVEAKKALSEKHYNYVYSGGRYELVKDERLANGCFKRLVFNEPEFLEDTLGNKSRSTIEIFIAKTLA